MKALDVYCSCVKGKMPLNCCPFRPDTGADRRARPKPGSIPMSDTFSRVEVIKGIARRWRFNTEQKLAVVAETI